MDEATARNVIMALGERREEDFLKKYGDASDGEILQRVISLFGKAGDPYEFAREIKEVVEFLS